MRERRILVKKENVFRVLHEELASIHQGGRTRHPEGGKGFD